MRNFVKFGEGWILRYLFLKGKGAVPVGIDLWLNFIREGTKVDK